LRQEFAEHQTVLRALNDREDGSPEGELTTGILDQIARYERLKIAERSRRGKLRKAREGKVVATKPPPRTLREAFPSAMRKRKTTLSCSPRASVALRSTLRFRR
jgi:DNA invertase Pin-like site-specific DNA recombinase